MRFESPFWLLSFIPLIVVIMVRMRKVKVPTILFPNAKKLTQIQSKYTKHVAQFSLYIRILILCLIIIALARPQKINVENEVLNKGIDIMLILDTSRSMAAEDFKPDNRLTVAKNTIKEFVARREHDRVGLIVFGSESFTQCPLTADYDILINLFDDVEFAMAGDGTAIGMAIINGLNR